MHAGYPFIADLRAVLFTHPQVYADISAIVSGEPRAAFYRYLQELVEAGFARFLRLREQTIARHRAM